MHKHPNTRISIFYSFFSHFQLLPTPSSMVFCMVATGQTPSFWNYNRNFVFDVVDFKPKSIQHLPFSICKRGFKILQHTYANIKSYCCTSETNIMLYANYISILKNIKRASLLMVKNPPAMQET
ncbi:unnamed protein product [Rangifer tarandus platyrhynchus]|uniref:Uncharacterized protein n=1 Tax=Rangifer tarandus platyrhynchus TaxID=3082113 RepID=A0AC59Z803_RANTA